MDRKFTLILCGSGWGAPDQRTALGPQTLYDDDFKKYLERHDIEVFSTFYHHADSIVTHNQFDQKNSRELTYHNLLAMFRHHAHICEQAVRRGRFPIILGGDHSIAIGTWSAIRAADQEKEFGLIWLDAHMDANTPATTPSNAAHGMPVAVLLGHGIQEWVDLCNFSPKLAPNRIAMIGIRDFDDGEANFLKEQDVQIFDMESVHQNGFSQCFKESLKIAKGLNGFYGVSIDVDAFDPSYAPGTGTPVHNGLLPDDALAIFQGMAFDPYCLGVEITEINLEKDQQDATRHFLQQLIQSILER